MAAFMAAFLMSPAQADNCKASYYWQGQKTATGARFNPNGLTTAHRSLPFGTRLRVSYRGKSVDVTVNDRGPFADKKRRCLDLSLGAARAIGMTEAGVVTVSFEKI